MMACTKTSKDFTMGTFLELAEKSSKHILKICVCTSH